MKKLLNAAAITAFIATLGLAAVSCTPKEPVRPAEKQLGVSIEVKSATENTVTAEIVAGKDATSYTYAIGEAGKLNGTNTTQRITRTAGATSRYGHMDLFFTIF